MMAKRKKNKSSTPRHKRMNRASRLQAAPYWIPKYNGSNLVRGYSKHFGVDHLCAVYELEQLGYKISDDYKQQLKQNQLQKQREAEQRKAKKEREMEESLLESDENFAFIAGYTTGGIPYGLKWDELDEGMD